MFLSFSRGLSWGFKTALYYELRLSVPSSNPQHGGSGKRLCLILPMFILPNYLPTYLPTSIYIYSYLPIHLSVYLSTYLFCCPYNLSFQGSLPIFLYCFSVYLFNILFLIVPLPRIPLSSFSAFSGVLFVS